MARVEYTLEGLKGVIAALERLGKADVDESLRQSRLAAGAIVRSAAMASTPNTTGRSTGTLASAHMAPYAGKYAAVVAVSRRQAPHTGLIHFGGKRGHFRQRGGPVKANPWLHDAAKSTEQAWYDAMAEGVQALLDRLAELT